MKLPHITPKQQALIRLIYRYRYVERKQLQAFLGHADKRRISAWLKELREKQFIDWFYEPNTTNETSKPATYFLSLNGIRLLRQEGYPEEELRKHYKDSTRQPDFIARCLLLADCGLHLKARNDDTDDAVNYSYALEADYADPDNDYAFLGESEFVHPNLVFIKEEDDDGDTAISTYFLEIFDMTTPRYMVKKKIKGYVEYLASDEWEKAKGGEELPIALIACPTLSEMIYAKRYTKKVLADTYGDGNDDIPDEVRIRFATVDKLRTRGVTAVIWEEA